MNKKIRIAFIKFGGLAVGGSERYLQVLAVNLPKDLFDIDYYYCDAAPYIGSDYKHGDTDPERRRYMKEHEINLIKFHVGFKDITKPTHDWVDTDFWDVFDESRYDVAITVKGGHPEYPYHLLQIPLIEIVGLPSGVDNGTNMAAHVHPSQSQRAVWYRMGGNLQKSYVIPPPPENPFTSDNFRTQLGIPESAVVAGFHQRNDNNIYSPIPLQAFARVFKTDRHFVILNGGSKYREQAKILSLKNVHFLPQMGESKYVSMFLNTIDIFAHGRRDGETYGAVFAEAMMHGLPCLSHSSLVGDNNGHIETMGPCGLFAYNLEDYVRHLDQLYNNPDLRKKLASKAVAHASRYFSLESCIEAMTRLLQQTCEQVPIQASFKRIPYGYSPYGFLQAGELEKPYSISHHILSGQKPEEFEVHITRFFLPHIHTFLDVGANIGLYCLVAAKECPDTAQVYAFEPQPECCDTLRQTVYLNNWEERLFVHQLGIGDQAGELELHLSGTGSSFDNSFNDNITLPTISVAVDTLDNQAQQLKLKKVDFIKIDVEGFEQQVLEGAAKTIERDQPVLFIEIADGLRGRQYRNPNYARTLRWLAEYGYQIWRSTEDSRLVLANPNEPQEHLAMYLCLHKEAHSQWLKEIVTWANKYRARKRKERMSRIVKKLRFGLRHPKLGVRKAAYLLKKKIWSK